MAVLLWAFSGAPDNPHRLESHRENQVVYTSIHDTDTLVGATGVEDPWPLIELALSSRCALAIVPAQDVLGLGSEARMNRPGVIGGNWAWRLEPGQLTEGHAARLRAAAAASGTRPTQPEPGVSPRHPPRVAPAMAKRQCDRDSGRLQGCAPRRRRGIRAAGIRFRGFLLAS